MPEASLGQGLLVRSWECECACGVCLCSWERRSGVLEKHQAIWELLGVLFFCTECCSLVLNGSALNSCNWCFVGLFFCLFVFLLTKEKILLWKQHCALSWSIIQNRFRLSCSLISTGVTHLQTCLMPWWCGCIFFKKIYDFVCYLEPALCMPLKIWKKKDKIVS